MQKWVPSVEQGAAGLPFSLLQSQSPAQRLLVTRIDWTHEGLCIGRLRSPPRCVRARCLHRVQNLSQHLVNILANGGYYH